jgi:4-hydroxy-3-methylbut-2-enyl diphosphate reductase
VVELTVVAPLRIEGWAIGGPVTIGGMGPTKASATGSLLAEASSGSPVALVGVAGGVGPGVRPGQLLVATEVRRMDGTVVRTLSGAQEIARDLRRRGADVRTGPLVSSPKTVRTAQARAELAASGAMAVDMEAAWLLDALGDQPVAVVRAISDSSGHGMVIGGVRALAALRAVRPSLVEWAEAVGDRSVVLAAPRSFCAGVERAIEIVDRALVRFGAPVYVRRQIVHNAHVVGDLESKGAIFVRELDEVPSDSVVVLAAHGVSPAVRSEAAARDDLRVIDATCPLVAKVHHEARRYSEQGYSIALIGHGDHEEVEGTIGEAPDRIRLVERAEDVGALDFAVDDEVAYLTQTTLATDETATIVAALRARFPKLRGPSSSDDICYATQNRQDAVRGLADRCDLVLVIGSANSSNTTRLAEVARRNGCRAELIEDETQLQLSWLSGVSSIGITAGASAPESLVQQVVASLGQLGSVRLTEYRSTEENVQFALPQQVR